MGGALRKTQVRYLHLLKTWNLLFKEKYESIEPFSYLEQAAYAAKYIKHHLDFFGEAATPAEEYGQQQSVELFPFLSVLMSLSLGCLPNGKVSKTSVLVPNHILSRVMAALISMCFADRGLQTPPVTQAGFVEVTVHLTQLLG